MNIEEVTHTRLGAAAFLALAASFCTNAHQVDDLPSTPEGGSGGAASATGASPGTTGGPEAAAPGMGGGGAATVGVAGESAMPPLAGTVGTESSSSGGGPNPDPGAPPPILLEDPGNVGCEAAELPKLKLVSIADLSATSAIPQIPVRPMQVVAPAGDDGLFLVDREGRVYVVRNGDAMSEPFIELIESIAPLPSERGLLALAFHPDYPDDDRFFLSYTRSGEDPISGDAFPGTGAQLGDLVIAEGRRSPTSPDRAESALRPIVVVDKEQRYHNGGTIAFGPDGLLYLSVGEDACGAACSQNTASPRGSILRLDVDDPEAAPAGNRVDEDPDAHPLVWSKGLRNPWRFSFDPLNGDLYIGEVGDQSWEEIDYQPFGMGYQNYGYPDCEATSCAGNGADYAAPIFEYPHGEPGQSCGNDPPDNPDDLAVIDEPSCARAVIGGHVHRSAAIPELWGRYLFADQPAGFIHSFIVEGGAATCFVDLTADLTEDTTLTTIVSLGQDASGNVYVVDQGGGIIDGLPQPGRVYRIERE